MVTLRFPHVTRIEGEELFEDRAHNTTTEPYGCRSIEDINAWFVYRIKEKTDKIFRELVLEKYDGRSCDVFPLLYL